LDYKSGGANDVNGKVFQIPATRRYATPLAGSCGYPGIFLAGWTPDGLRDL
jgi:hypothetical protein